MAFLAGAWGHDSCITGLKRYDTGMFSFMAVQGGFVNYADSGFLSLEVEMKKTGTADTRQEAVNAKACQGVSVIVMEET